MPHGISLDALKRPSEKPSIPLKASSDQLAHILRSGGNFSAHRFSGDAEQG